ncbi:MAG: AraC family transcriptional regulator [Eubacteriales bacterium]|nr:AraC family transcriptional regulator [Eubacteriales bacterium]
MGMNMREDRSEILLYDIPDNPIFFRNNEIPACYDFHEEILHWHDEVEFIYVYEGSVWYQVNDKNVLINSGQGIFVNARQLHVIKSNHQDTRLYCLIFHPTLLCASSYITKTYLLPVLEHTDFPYLLFSQENDWEKLLLDDIAKINSIYENDQGNLQVIQLLFHIWQLLYEHISWQKKEKIPENEELSSIKRMLDFIQNHYMEKISLQEICDAGGYGKTKGSAVFRKYLNTSPMEHLKMHRVIKSCQFLEETNLSVTEIATRCGFSDGSYYGKIFRSLTKMSPLDYRKKCKTLKEKNDVLQLNISNLREEL